MAKSKVKREAPRFKNKRDRFNREIKELLELMTPNRNPIRLPSESEAVYNRFLYFCKWDGNATRAYNDYIAVLHRGNPDVGKRRSGAWSEFRKVHNWDMRFQDWRDAIRRIEYLEDQLDLLDAKSAVIRQTSDLDEIYSELSDLVHEGLSLPINVLRPKLAELVSAGGLLLSINQERQKATKRGIDEAIDSLVEQGLAPEALAQRSQANLARYHEEQRKAILGLNEEEEETGEEAENE